MSDLIDVLEAAYQLEGTPEEWLRGIMMAAAPVLDRGLGLGGFFFDLARDPPCWSPVIFGDCPLPLDALIGGALGTTEAMRRKMFDNPRPVSTASEVSGLGADLPNEEAWRRWYGPHGVRDALNVTAFDARGSGCFLGALLPRVETATRRFKGTWSRIAAHMAAGRRLHSTHADARPAEDRLPEAILTPGGRLIHAEGPAKAGTVREALSDGARKVDRARGQMRRTNPDEAVELWQALIAGRWSLVDHFDTDGLRFIAARRNDPNLPGADGALTERERQVCACAALGHANKLIAYELGIATSTVGTLLGRAAAKLGVSSRTELIAAVRNGST